MSGPTTTSAVPARAPAGDPPLVPVQRELIADMLTPVSAYARLCPPGHLGFLLESVEGGERLARYSYIGYRPQPLDLGDGDPLHALAAIAGQQPVPAPGLPRFLGGAVGYLGYEVARHFERLPASTGPAPGMPESAFMLAENVAVFDHVTQRLKLLTLHRPDREPYEAALVRLDEMEARLHGDQPAAPAKPSRPIGEARWTSNVSRGRYESMVDAAREEILAGEAFQVVLSQRFSRPLAARPLDVYRCLRSINPSPYMFYLSFGDGRHVVGTSPELLVRVDGDSVVTRPLAGTRRRGADQEEDRALERELLTDAKERAEHVMLVDLGRNDVGRVAVPGSVRVERLMEVERYSHVMHISSTVSGRLAPASTSLDALRATFPAGTLSGAPKIRAMEIIAELEPDQRGCYGGALGYVGFGGNMDMAITLRTIVIADDTVHVQSGAGVVADSDPAREFQETLEKAGAMFAAVEQAERLQ
ncbi:MAG TPA: chorismate-binding protein [Candidatus Dormibacteraeota bacterium]|nr:chorismate-binding protein [Candidatus Dormibacteraeota bacterium]